MNIPKLVRVYLTYDLEATFIQKGKSRKDTKILEIALYNDRISYQRLVNPLTEYQDGEEVMANLHSLYQHTTNTLNFWVKLLVGKKALPSNMNRKNTFEKAEAISTLLKRSDEAKKHDDAEGMMQALARNKDDLEEAKKDIRKGDTSFNQLFYTPHEALEGALKAADGYSIWCGHNGKAFDEKILKGHEDHDWDHITFVDSLPLLKQLKPGLVSYSQPLVYKQLFNDKYFAHHALDDSIALWKIMEHVLGEECILETHQNLKPKKKKSKEKVHPTSNLYELKGIGTKSVAQLYQKDIKTKEDLMKLIDSITFKQWCDKFSFVHHHKKFYNMHKTQHNSAVV